MEDGVTQIFEYDKDGVTQMGGWGNPWKDGVTHENTV